MISLLLTVHDVNVLSMVVRQNTFVDTSFGDSLIGIFNDSASHRVPKRRGISFVRFSINLAHHPNQKFHVEDAHDCLRGCRHFPLQIQFFWGTEGGVLCGCGVWVGCGVVQRHPHALCGTTRLRTPHCHANADPSHLVWAPYVCLIAHAKSYNGYVCTSHG